MKKILVIIDMQQDFISGALKNAHGEEVTEQVLREIGKDYDSFLLTRDTHGGDYLSTHEGRHLPIAHCIQNSEGWEIRGEVLEAVKGTGKPYRIYDKKGFGSPELMKDLEALSGEIESVTVVGLCTDICVITNALLLRAGLYNTPIFYVSKAMSATSDENQQAAIRILNACQIYEKDEKEWNR